MQDIKGKLETYKEKLINLSKKLTEEKNVFVVKKEKLTVTEKKMELEGMLLAEKQRKLSVEKIKLAKEITEVIQNSQLIREKTEIIKEAEELTSEMKRVAKERMELVEEMEEPPETEIKEAILRRRRLAMHEVDLMKKRVSIEEKILAYEDRLLATEEKDAARGRVRALFGERDDEPCAAAGPEPERERRGTDTRAEPATPRPRGLRGRRAGGSDLLSPPPQRPVREIRPLIRGPSRSKTRQWGLDARDPAGELGRRPQDPVLQRRRRAVSYHLSRASPAYPNWSRCAP